MKTDKKNLRIDDLPLRSIEEDLLEQVAGGLPPHDCVTASGDTCEGDDCGPIRVGSTCGG